MNYSISQKAVEDIEHIWLYTVEHWSVEQTDRYYDLIFDEIEYIAEHFEAGKDIGYIRKGYRCMKVKSHLVCYKKSKEQIVEIVRILHERMDIENRLND